MIQMADWFSLRSVSQDIYRKITVNNIPKSHIISQNSEILLMKSTKSYFQTNLKDNFRIAKKQEIFQMLRIVKIYIQVIYLFF